MTTFEPGASEVLTHGLRCRPRSTALRATRPAASITEGFDVFVQDVMAAIVTAPWSSVTSSPEARCTAVGVERAPLDRSESASIALARSSGTRSWGREGPARDGTTVARSSSTVSLKRGSTEGSCHMPCSLVYASTSATSASVRPLRRR